MAVDPIALEERGISRREEQSAAGGFDVSKGLETGIKLGGSFAKGVEMQEQKQKAAEFEQLLNSQEEGMQKFIQEMEAEGLDISTLPDPKIYTKSKDDIANWYNISVAEREKQVKTRAKTKGIGQFSKGEERAAIETFAETDILSGKEAIGEIGKIKTREQVEEILKAGATGTRDVPPSETDPDILQGSIDATQEVIDRLSTSPVSGEPSVRAKIASLGKKVSDLQKRISRSKTDFRFAEKETRLRDEAQLKAGEKFLKDKTEVLKMQVSVDKVEEALVQLGLPDGLDTIDPTVDIPGAGFAGEKFRRFVKSPGGVKFIANVERLIAADRHDLYGAALTKTEQENFKAMLGRNFLGNERQFLEALRAIKRINEEALRGTPRQLEILEESQTPEERSPRIRPTKKSGLTSEQKARIKELRKRKAERDK